MLVCNRTCNVKTKLLAGMDESCLYVIASVAQRHSSCQQWVNHACM